MWWGGEEKEGEAARNDEVDRERERERGGKEEHGRKEQRDRFCSVIVKNKTTAVHLIAAAGQGTYNPSSHRSTTAPVTPRPWL